MSIDYPLLLAFKPIVSNQSVEIFVNHTIYETRVAILENGVLQDLLIERKKRRGIVGNIYKGKVQRVLPGMDAAFVDIGEEKAGFLHIKNINLNGENTLRIEDLLHEGQSIMVQVIKDPISTKGARLTTDISIPSRFLVFLPYSDDIGISIKISSAEQRQNLRDLLGDFHKGRQGGFIVRTAISHANTWAMHADMQYLYRIWESILNNYQNLKPGSLLYSELALHNKILRDYISPEVSRVLVDNLDIYHDMNIFDNSFLLEMKGRIQYYSDEIPLFERYGIEEEIKKALRDQVSLKSGGYIIIEQTEAMTTIDVNTGSFVGKNSQEETIFKTNLEAAKAIARQLRLRNLGGVIMIDFIDMNDTEHQQLVINTLANTLSKDKARYSISSVTPLGIVELTRKRTRESLRQMLCEPCPKCNGAGYIKTIETVVYDLFRNLIREIREFSPKEVKVIGSANLIDYIREEENDTFSGLQEILNTRITLVSSDEYSSNRYDIALL